MTTTMQKYLNNVLLIDHNEIDNYINRKILENCGATNILTFKSPIMALQFLEQTKEIPQLILLDIDFPVMNGFELYCPQHQIRYMAVHSKLYHLSSQ